MRRWTSWESSVKSERLLDTTDFSRVVVLFLPKEAKQQRFLDTTDFSRVVLQFLPNSAASKKAETETPRD